MNGQVSAVRIPDGSNLTNDDATILAFSIDGSENGIFTGNFVPPPPRPVFLDEGVTSDGLTTCDLCSWAWKSGNPYVKDINIESSSELGWVLTLVIVSLLSAVLGAIIMITVFHCKRLKSLANTNEVNCQSPSNRPPINTPNNKMFPSPSENFSNQSNGVWSWLSRRSVTTSSQLENPPLSFVENHYTHMEDGYNCGVDALYAELDVGSAINRTAYHNSAYADPDAPSAPSSAYYSDLSVSTVPDRAYEVVGLAVMPVWESNGDVKKQANKLDVISEGGATAPSDYV